MPPAPPAPPRGWRDLSPTFQALRPRPFALTKTRAASRPGASRRGQALITRLPPAPIGPLCLDRARIGWRAPGPAPGGRGVFWFASEPRPDGRALGGRPAPPAPLRPRQSRAARAGGGACRPLEVGSRAASATHVQQLQCSEHPPRRFVACGLPAPCTRRAPWVPARRAR